MYINVYMTCKPLKGPENHMTEMTEIGVPFNMINTQGLTENEFFLLLNLQKAISVASSGYGVVIM